MLYFFNLLLLFLNIDQETVLNWFGIENKKTINPFSPTIEITTSSNISFETLKLILNELWQRVQDGLTLADIENILFFIIFLRFLILAIRYNIKTSFYITLIGLFAGYLWYKHLIDLLSMYRSILIKLPYLNKLGIDAVQLRSLSRQMVLTDLKLEDNIHWYNPGKLVYYGFTKGIINLDIENGLRYYIDPFSMLISKLNQPEQQKILPIYYTIYNKIIPQIFHAFSKFWGQLSGIAAYAVITRIGKRYCPYLIRWHWTFLLIVGFIEQILIYFIFRVSYFQSFVLIPQTQVSNNYIDQNLILQINSLNGLIMFLVSIHLSFIFFGLFHAIWGQYFYFPFFVENTELHIGPRPKNSIYSGGNTVWQDEKEKNIQRIIPKLWYGWFGSGYNNESKVFQLLKKSIKNLLKKLNF